VVEPSSPRRPLRGALAAALGLALLVEGAIRVTPLEDALSLNLLPHPDVAGDYFPDQAGTHRMRDARPPRDWSWTINSQGLRGAEPQNADLRVVAVGDSFTFGEGVGDAQAWPARLQHHLIAGGCSASVANAGVLGRDVRGASEWLAERGSRLRPDVVVWMLIANDLEALLDRRADTDLRAAIHAVAPGPWFSRTLGRSLALRLAVMPAVMLEARRHPEPRPSTPTQAWQVAGELLDVTDVPRLLVWMQPPGPWTFEALRASTRHPALDAAAWLDAQGPSPTWWAIPGDGHPDVTAHDLLGQRIAAELPCPPR
jgi:hypothetical protein